MFKVPLILPMICTVSKNNIFAEDELWSLIQRNLLLSIYI